MTIVNLLRERMIPEPIAQPEYIGLASPADKGDLNLSLFLYSIQENGESRRNEKINRGTHAQQYPPLTLNFHYMLTAYSNADVSSKLLDEHRILGKAMQAIYDHSILRNPHLVGSLSETNEEIRIRMESIPPETQQDMWNFADSPFKLSAFYVVGPVRVDSTRIQLTQRVLEKDVSVHDKV